VSDRQSFSTSKTFLLGFGFFGVSIIWSLYNAYVPIFLKSTFGLRSSVIGSVMTIDNIFAILLLPFLGALSDRTRTRLGRRRPYILVGSTLALIFFVLVPYFNTVQILGLMMLTIIFMNLSMALFRSPVIALMPDITPSKYRSQANGIINFMGGLGALLVFFGGKPLYDRRVSLPFLVGGFVMFAASMLVVIFVKEKLPDAGQEGGSAPAGRPAPGTVSFRDSVQELAANLKDVFAGERSLFFILLGILFWFIGFNSLETFFTSYAKYHLGMKESTGALILGFFSVTFMVTSIASGFLGSRIGRRRTIRIGLVILVVILIVSLFVRQFLPLALVFVVGGFGWALVNVNSLPMVVDMTTLAKVGGYTGLYYFFSQAANIAAPPLAGLLIDAFGYASLMIFAAFMFFLAFFIMSFVKRGEVEKEG
jgi:Na+/melibiose symporter-like transporter